MTTTERLTDGSAPVSLMKRLEGESRLDPVITRVAPVVDRVVTMTGLRAVLLGRPIGHAIHPLLTDLPLGLWTATNVLDLMPLPGSRQSAQRLLTLGIASAPAVFVTGWAEWREAGRAGTDNAGTDNAGTENAGTENREQRVGLVHAVLNASGLVLYVLSLRSRRRDRHAMGVALALGGIAAVSAAGYLGGHLTAVRKVSSHNPEFDV